MYHLRHYCHHLRFKFSIRDFSAEVYVRLANIQVFIFLDAGTFCSSANILGKDMKKSAGRTTFIFHLGMTLADGSIHISPFEYVSILPQKRDIENDKKVVICERSGFVEVGRTYSGKVEDGYPTLEYIFQGKKGKKINLKKNHHK